ncbi:AAA family ATPase [Candidatus Epulonipiscium fishelsonii]|uniref:AAA family ATPase n=1 Tax=Candidatus Epulonipiscium fishelsonii TaxID=77094 RepID=A0ACC8XC13_9FIRM|nr:AAA family ATPase [Epulopiscium sp. SCG-B05WGA-EpuloA1]ONI40046.1 AAA family ATPase [Epulopiscium sp. SCG-B11WGA-EpuloA1]
MEEEIILEGVIEDIVYQNKENWYTVCVLDNKGEPISCVGTMPEVYEGENLQVIGIWCTHHIYGKQLKVSTFNKSLPQTVQGIEKYLASGLIKGIGAKTAHKIVARFGTDTLKIIEQEPLKLTQIRGISKDKASKISEAYHSQYEFREVIIGLEEFGINPTYAIKIYKLYKDKTFNIIKSNPYILIEDIIGIGFNKADEIAKKIGIEDNDPNRIKSGILFVLNKFANNGHTYVPKDILNKECQILLNGDKDLIENAFLSLSFDNKIIVKVIDDNTIIFLTYLYYGELNIATKLLSLKNGYNPSKELLPKILNYENEIKTIEHELNIKLVEEQKQAILSSLTNGVTVITGGPGTGKTTTINALLEVLKECDCTFSLAAPTGRAAKRISETTAEQAQTIHRLLEIGYVQDSKKQIFNKDENNPLEVDVLILDEVSMIDVVLMNAVLKALFEGQRLILIGDADQLPSVGAGNVLKDIIQSNQIQTIRLKQIFRQATKSAIINNAHRINKGEYPISNEKDTDFFFMNKSIQQEIQHIIPDLILNRVPKYQRVNALKDIQVLSPMRKGLLGTIELNTILQQILNPSQKHKPEKEYRTTTFRVGDKVMQIKNNYNIPWKIFAKNKMVIDEGVGVFNGDCGIISNINSDVIEVMFEDCKIVDYEFNQLDELELAYAITIHKSQGSEYPVVIIPIHSGPPMLFSRNLLYTAITRAKKMVIGIGLQETMCRMIDNNQEIERYSNLKRHLEIISEQLLC